MAFPINFVAGAAIGAVTTYVLKDDSAKDWVTGTSKKLKDQTGSYIAKMQEKRAAKKAEKAARVAAEAAGDATESVVEGAKAATA